MCSATKLFHQFDLVFHQQLMALKAERSLLSAVSRWHCAQYCVCGPTHTDSERLCTFSLFAPLSLCLTGFCSQVTDWALTFMKGTTALLYMSHHSLDPKFNINPVVEWEKINAFERGASQRVAFTIDDNRESHVKSVTVYDFTWIHLWRWNYFPF